MEASAKPLPETPHGAAGPSPSKRDSRPRSGIDVPKRKSRGNTELPDEDEDEEFEFFHKFEREKIKGVLHLITSELKERGTSVEYIMIPFRPEQKNEKLLKFLNQLFPMGNGQPVKKAHQQKIISKTEVWTLFQGIKYIWCRLPNSEIIGWKSYLEFKYREADKKYPQKAFLEIMPQCLESCNHASIVYDFFDLIVTLASNSKVNKMSARKICKMCAVWAFNKPSQNISTDGPSYDFDSNGILPRYKKVNNSFQDGLDEWIPASDAMFHLLLSFLKSFVPKDLESAKLPRSLKSILFNNEYPPKDSTAYTSETILTIPLVTLYTDKFSRKPWQLLERCNEMLDFSDYDAFEAREDYALLKSLFKKKNNVEGISRKMSQESRRIMKAMSTKHSTFQAGWAPRKCLENTNHLEDNIQVRRVDIDDYFIWTWLSTLSYEQTSQKKMLFGRSVILEFEFDGFKKWVCFQECDITLDYNSRSQLKDKTVEEEARSRSNSPTKSRKDASSVKSRREPTEIPKIKNEPQMYEKFQVSNEKSSRMPSAQQIPQPQPSQYHTTISLDALNKNGKQPKSSFDKISKWNPLHNLRKKSNSSSGSSLTSSQYDDRVPSNGERNSSNSSNRGNDMRNVSDYGAKPSKKYELPPIEPDTDDFKIDLPDISPDMIDAPSSDTRSQPSSRQQSQYPPSERTSASTNVQRDTLQSNSETIEEINEMVENMISDELSEEQPIEVGLSDTFRNVTKFEQYKPSAMKGDDFETSLSSTVQSLKLNSPQDAAPPRNIENPTLRNNGSNLSIEQVAAQRHSPVHGSPTRPPAQDMSYQRGNAGEQPGAPTYHSPPKQQGGRWPNPQVPGPANPGAPPMDNMRNGVNPQHQDRRVYEQQQQQPYAQPPRQGKPPQGNKNMAGPQQDPYGPTRPATSNDPYGAGRPATSNDPYGAGRPTTSNEPNGPPVKAMGNERGRGKHQHLAGPPMNAQPQQIPQKQGRGGPNPKGMYPPPGPPQPGYGYSNSPQRTQSPMRQPRSSSPMRNPQGPGQYMGAPSPGFYNQNMPMQQARSSSPMRQGGPQMGPPMGMPKSQSQYPMPRPPQGPYNNHASMVPSPSMQQMSPQQRTNGFNMQPMPMGPNYGSPQFAQGPMMQGYGPGYGTATPPPPNTIPMQAQHGGAATKLHGNVNKRQDRRQLYDNIRSGNFGI